MSSPFGEVIFSYTRAQAIEDGVLIDVTEQAREAGFRYHTVITTGVKELLDQQPDVTEENWGALLLGLLITAKYAIGGEQEDNDRVYFDFRGQRCWMHCGPGDDAEPVLTLMLENED